MQVWDCWNDDRNRKRRYASKVYWSYLGRCHFGRIQIVQKVAWRWYCSIKCSSFLRNWIAFQEKVQYGKFNNFFQSIFRQQYNFCICKLHLSSSCWMVSCKGAKIVRLSCFLASCCHIFGWTIPRKIWKKVFHDGRSKNYHCGSCLFGTHLMGLSWPKKYWISVNFCAHDRVQFEFWSLQFLNRHWNHARYHIPFDILMDLYLYLRNFEQNHPSSLRPR